MMKCFTTWEHLDCPTAIIRTKSSGALMLMDELFGNFANKKRTELSNISGPLSDVLKQPSSVCAICKAVLWKEKKRIEEVESTPKELTLLHCRTLWQSRQERCVFLWFPNRKGPSNSPAPHLFLAYRSRGAWIPVLHVLSPACSIVLLCFLFFLLFQSMRLAQPCPPRAKSKAPPARLPWAG